MKHHIVIIPKRAMSERQFVERDHNAALNILERGERSVGLRPARG
jgi:hypothetical protein